MRWRPLPERSGGGFPFYRKACDPCPDRAAADDTDTGIAAGTNIRVTGITRRSAAMTAWPIPLIKRKEYGLNFHHIMDDEHTEAALGRLEPDVPVERRLVMRLLRHWRDKAGDRRFPLCTDIDFSAIPDIEPWAWRAVVRPDDTIALILEVVGTRLTEDCGTALVGLTLTEIPVGTLMAAATKYHGDVLAREIPISIGGELKHRDGRHLLYRSIILPLSDNGTTVSHLHGAANCRAVTVA